MRNGKFTKFYNPIQLTRKFLFALFVVFLGSHSRDTAYSILLAGQVGYLVLLFIMRPYKHLLQNIQEWMHESFLTLFLILLLSHNDSQDWGTNSTDAYFALLLVHLALTLLVLFGKCPTLIISIVYSVVLILDAKSTPTTKQISDGNNLHLETVRLI